MGGKKKTIGSEWFTAQGLAWSPDGKEVWFTASKSGTDRTLYATTLDGDSRIVARLPGALMLLDIAKDGRLLLMRASWRRELMALGAGDAKERGSPGSITRTRRIFPLMARRCFSMKKAEAVRWIIRSRAD
jgi:hypothetical protein